MRRTLIAIVVCLCAPLAMVTTAAGAQPGGIDISEATGGRGVPTLASTTFDPASVGYERAEYLLSGTARSYTSAQPLTVDGKWTVTPESSAPYTTRAVVYRPADPRDFNGTVMVEWLNVSAGFDSAPIWLAAHTELVRKGFAWIGLTAQSVGVDGGNGQAIVPNLDLKHADPERYATLAHPGDSYSYDMYTQTGDAVRSDAATLLGGLKPKHVIAVGESQSAFRMVTYINAFGKDADNPYDGFLVYSRGSNAAALAEAPQAAVTAPKGTLIRTDLAKPVLTFTTETDLVVLGSSAAQQADSKWFREWQVAGTAHADTYTTALSFDDTGTQQGYDEMFAAMRTPPNQVGGGFITCATPINAGPMTYVLRTAVDSLDRWVVDGTPPPRAARLATLKGSSPPQFRLDADGNAQGGVRTPHLQVPIATLSGLGQSGQSFCGTFGSTVPFDAAKLASLYPSHEAFSTQWSKAVDAAVKAGFLMPDDAKGLKVAAAQSTIGGTS